jgi:hypothetical protein
LRKSKGLTGIRPARADPPEPIPPRWNARLIRWKCDNRTMEIEKILSELRIESG